MFSSNQQLQIAQTLHNNKKWKPTYLEKTMLEFQFSKDQLPSQENRQQLSKKLHDTFNTNVSANELQEWFEDEMSKTSKRLKTDNFSTNSYIKLTTEEEKILEESFDMKNYPNIKEMQEMAQELGVNLPKIENWFKHHRRSLAKKGQFHIKTKRYFQPNDLKVLMSVFLKTPHPTPQQISIVAQQLNCTENQIKNWYSNKRKRVRNLKKNEGSEISLHENQELSSSSSESPRSSPKSPECATSVPSLTSLTKLPQGQFLMPLSQPVPYIFDTRTIWPSLKNLNYPASNLSYPPQGIQQYSHLAPQAYNLNSHTSLSQPLANTFFNQSGILDLHFKAPIENHMGARLSNLQELQNLLSSQLALQNKYFVQNHTLNNLHLSNWRNGAIFSQTRNFTAQGEAYN